MQYQKIVLDEAAIEFHNNWLGEETVIVNGQIVSKKSSVWGTHHHFTLMEEGRQARYVLTSKMDAHMQVYLDLHKNGEPIREDVRVSYGTLPKKPVNTAKKNGILKLNAYELDEAVEELIKALDIDPDDPEIYFHLACAHSIGENAALGFECLRKAVELRLPNTEMILNHDMLAFIRMHEAFESFLSSNFTEYDRELVKDKDREWDADLL